MALAPSASTVAVGPPPPACTVSPADRVTAQPLDAARGWALTPHHGGTGLVVDAEQGGRLTGPVGQVDDDGAGTDDGGGRRGDGAPGVEHDAAGDPQARRRGGHQVDDALSGARAGRAGRATVVGAKVKLLAVGCTVGAGPAAAGAEGRADERRHEQGAGGADGDRQGDTSAAGMRRTRRHDAGGDARLPRSPRARTDGARRGLREARGDGTRTARRRTIRSAPRRRSLLTDPADVAARRHGRRCAGQTSLGHRYHELLCH